MGERIGNSSVRYVIWNLKNRKNPATSKQQKLHPCESFFKHLPHVEVPDSCDLEAWKFGGFDDGQGNPCLSGWGAWEVKEMIGAEGNKNSLDLKERGVS